MTAVLEKLAGDKCRMFPESKQLCLAGHKIAWNMYADMPDQLRIDLNTEWILFRWTDRYSMFSPDEFCMLVSQYIWSICNKKWIVSDVVAKDPILETYWKFIFDSRCR